MSLGSPVLARRYARALSELAESQSITQEVGESLDRIRDCWNDNGSLQTAFSSPELGSDERRAVIREIGGRLFLNDMVIKTLCLLSDRRRMALVPALRDAFFALSEQKQDRVQAEVTTAARLSEAYFEQLQQTLEEVTGKKVTLTRHLDPGLLGGVVTKVGDKVFDGSLRTRLDELEEELLLP